MAEKLEVTVSFLSAVENGKKHMPAAWNGKICSLYDLSEEQKREFTTAIAETEDVIEMNLVSANLERRELAVSFARRKLYPFILEFTHDLLPVIPEMNHTFHIPVTIVFQQRHHLPGSSSWSLSDELLST